MNKPIRRLAVFCMVLFGALLINANYLQAINAENLREHPRNARQTARQFDAARGSIIVGNEQIAYSEPTGDDSAYDYQRRYKSSEEYAHLTGFYSLYNATGIESAENSMLNGSDNRLAVSNFMDTITGEEVQGASVELTINPDAQEAAFAGLRSVGKNGAAVALDPSTGAVLASASLPTYDANPLSHHDPSEVVAEYERLDEDEDKPLLDRALNQRYPPGSTFKIVTAAAALEDGATPDSTQPAPATYNMPAGGTMPNASGGACNGGDPDTLQHSIEISCNTSMGHWAVELGEDKMAQQAEAFGLDGGEMQIPLTVSESSYPRGLDDSQLAQTGIGQFDVAATPLQMAMVAGGVANGGDVMKPYLIDTVQSSDLTELETANPEVLSQAVSSSTASDLTDMMVEVTQGDEGSGKNGAISGIEVAGKTGTAETGEGPTHNWFISFAPADDPQVAVAVVIENGGGSGGELAAPVAKSIMEAVIDE
ncbi:peptidoglycan D,D-transpeptidase FtsI family protein [Allosalinactinospora lopnorensis]|uniref:peptidoglycan D,D-transpeptidase FtsI family protein n=1 Tax=Allosalinactinospora lopnorensis TaxID=1352348 RepID=UPI000623FBF4|nr:penicillin-binding protein 2 [Allosalinactinospora lopnorensis]